MFLIAIIVGSLIMAIFGRYPFIGPILAGMICTFIMQDARKGMLSAFISGSFTGIFAAVFLTIIGTLLATITFGLIGGTVAGVIGTLMATGKIITALYFGCLGAFGGFLGGKALPYVQKNLPDIQRRLLK